MGKESIGIEYAALMRHNSEGTYLYSPPLFREFYPGSCGFFDSTGGWKEITNLTDPEQVKSKGYSPVRVVLDRKKNPQSSVWESRTSNGSSKRGGRAAPGFSGALTAGVPVDASVEGKGHSGRSGKAALVTGPSVTKEEIDGPFDEPVVDWVKANAVRLVGSDWAREIKKNGLWVIQIAYVTQECGVRMLNETDRDFNLALDIGVTGVGKLGVGGEWSEKLESVGWTTFKATTEDKGLVVSFAGIHFKPTTFSSFYRGPMKEAKADSYLRTGEPNEFEGTSFDLTYKKVGTGSGLDEEEKGERVVENESKLLESKRLLVLRTLDSAEREQGPNEERQYMMSILNNSGDSPEEAQERRDLIDFMWNGMLEHFGDGILDYL